MQGRETTSEAGRWRRLLLRIRRRYRQWQGVEPRTRVQIRCEREEWGGWALCRQVLRSGDVVYSFDNGGDLRIEQTLLREHGARVYMFDPDPEVAVRAEEAGLLDTLQLYAIRVGGENRPADAARGVDGARMVRLASLMRMLGHRRLDLIKLNVDSAPAAIRDLVSMAVDVRQLLITVPECRSTEDRERVETLLGSLEEHGYRSFHISPDGRRYSFLRTDFGDA